VESTDCNVLILRNGVDNSPSRSICTVSLKNPNRSGLISHKELTSCEEIISDSGFVVVDDCITIVEKDRKINIDKFYKNIEAYEPPSPKPNAP
jgi:hypothetical protein